MAVPKYRLIYWNAKARAETSRQLFAVAGVEYEDVRIEDEDWPPMKSQQPFGQLPVLEVDGLKLGQSIAINRFLARKFGLAGKTPWEEALVDSLADQYADYYLEIRPWHQRAAGWADGDKDEVYESVAVPARDKFFPCVVKFLQKAGVGYLVGDSLTFVDLTIAEHVDRVCSIEPHHFDKYPKVFEHRDKIHSIPALKKWLTSRPSPNSFV